MAIIKKIENGTEISAEINLDEMFGEIVPNSSQFRQAVGQAIIDKIRERTDDSKFGPGSSRKGYSEEYAESDDGIIFGKKKGEPVNLRASGDMLNLMTIIEEKKNSIIIGWDDSEQARKAHGHVTGGIGVKRDFLYLTQGEAEDIVDRFKDYLPQADVSRGVNSSTGRLGEFLSGERRATPQTTLTQLVESFFDDDEG